MTSFPLSANGTTRTFGARIRAARETWAGDPAVHRAALAGVIVVAIAVRVYHLSQPMRLDEAWTYLKYVSQPLGSALSDYSLPNNHLFHTLLVWFTAHALGDAEWVIRLPAFMAGILLVPGTYVAGRMLSNRDGGLFAAALAAGLPSKILYSTNARGYTIICLAFVVLLCLATSILDDEGDRWSVWITFAIVEAIGMYTAPVMLYPIGVVNLWIVVDTLQSRPRTVQVRRFTRLLAASALSAILTILLNLPIVLQSGVAPLVSNRFVTPLTSSQFVHALPQFVRSLRNTLALGLSVTVILLMAAAAGFALARRSRRRAKLVSLAASAIVACTLLLIATRRPPFARVWLFLVPLACVYVGAGFAALAESLKRVSFVRDRQLVAAVAVLATALLAGSTIYTRAVFDSTETGTLKNGPEIARYLLPMLKPGDRIVALAISEAPLDYYLHRFGRTSSSKFANHSASGRVYVVFNHQFDGSYDELRSRRRTVRWEELELDQAPRRFSHATVYTLRRRALPRTAAPTAERL